MTASQIRRLADRTGRALLVGAVAFWWGLIVVPRLVSLALPDLLPPDAIPESLDPDLEGSVANAVSATALLTVGILAFATAVASHRRAVGWIAAGGWAALAVTAAYLAWEEVSGFHDVGTRAFGETVLGAGYRSTLWPVLVSPLILAFVLAMAVFVHKGLCDREVRAPLVFGIAAWLLAIVHEASFLFVFKGNVAGVEQLLEETLEFGGTLLIALSAGVALGRSSGQAHGRQARDASRQFGGRGRFPLKVWSMAAIAIIACVIALGVIVPSLNRAPLADARARAHVGTFHMSLDDSPVEEHSLVQELGALAAPPARIDLRVANHDRRGRPGNMIWRMLEAGEGGSGRVLREGRMEVAARDYLSWESIDFPPPVEAEGRPLALQLVADVEPDAHLRIGATKTNRYEDGRLWVNGELTWPDQNIEFVIYGAPELTRSKLRAMLRVFTSHWRWPVMVVDTAITMTVITLIPALLITTALRRRGSP